MVSSSRQCPPSHQEVKSPPGVESGGNGRVLPPPTDAFRQLGGLASELREYLSYFLAAKVDGFRLSIRSAGIYAALGVLGFVAVSALIATSVVLLLVGTATGLGWLFGGRLWLGSVVVALLVLGAFGLGGYLALSRLNRNFRTKTVEKYEHRQEWQRGQFGRDVEQTAARQHV